MLELDYDLQQLTQLALGPASAPFVPARKLKKNYRSVTGFITIKGRQQTFESDLEHDYLTLLDFDPSVETVFQQPITIRYRYEPGRWNVFTPDFFVRRFDRSMEVVEIKYRKELRQEWPQLRPRYRAAVAFAKRAVGPHCRFIIKADHKIRIPALRQIQFLRDFRDYPERPSICRTIEVAAALPFQTVESLAGAAAGESSDKGAAVAQVWRMVWTGVLAANLDRPLGLHTQISLARPRP